MEIAKSFSWKSLVNRMGLPLLRSGGSLASAAPELLYSRKTRTRVCCPRSQDESEPTQRC